LQAACEARAHGGEGKNFYACCGEFDGERQSVQAIAYLDNGGCVFATQFEIRFGGAGALEKERDCGIFRELLNARLGA
jgi:hypothetical protein